MTDKIPSIAVSIRASRAYVRAINELAKREGYATTSDFVRAVFDDNYSEKLSPLLSFFEHSDYKNSQSGFYEVNSNLTKDA